MSKSREQRVAESIARQDTIAEDTEEEFAELVRNKNPFILRALAEGIRV